MDLRISLIDGQTTDLLKNIAKSVFDSDPTPEFLEPLIADPSNMLLVALHGSLVIGQIKAAVHRHPEKPPSLFVEELGVGEEFRRQGVAIALMQAVKTLATDMGCAEIWLATEPDNDAANAFYKAFGLGGQHVVMYSGLLRP